MENSNRFQRSYLLRKKKFNVFKKNEIVQWWRETLMNDSGENRRRTTFDFLIRRKLQILINMAKMNFDTGSFCSHVIVWFGKSRDVFLSSP